MPSLQSCRLVAWRARIETVGLGYSVDSHCQLMRTISLCIVGRRSMRASAASEPSLQAMARALTWSASTQPYSCAVAMTIAMTHAGALFRHVIRGHLAEAAERRRGLRVRATRMDIHQLLDQSIRGTE